MIGISWRREQGHAFPMFLPDGRAILFTIRRADSLSNSQIAVLDLDTMETTALVVGDGRALYAPTGHVIYGQVDTLEMDGPVDRNAMVRRTRR